MAISVIATLVASRASGTFLPFWAPREDALSVAWQVHASFISIGFAGLAIAFQLLSDPPLAAGPARRAIIARLRFAQVVVFSVGADVVAGLGAIWFRSDLSTIVIFSFVLLPSMTAIGYLYLRTARIFSRPREIEQWTFDDLVAVARKIAVELADVRQKNETLHLNISDLYGFSVGSQPSFEKLKREVLPKQTGVVDSVNYDLLSEVSRLVSESISVSDKPSASPGTNPSSENLVSIEFIPRIGDELVSDVPVARIFSAADISPATLKSLTEMLSRSLVVRTRRDEYGGQHLQKEMEDLQDNLILTIKGGKYSAAKRGYEYYRAVAAATRQKILDVSPSEAQVSSSQDWNWLARQIWEINDAAISAGHRFIMMATSAAFGRSADSVADRDLGSLRSSMASYEQIWQRSISMDENADIVGDLLVSFQSLTEYVVPSKEDSSKELLRAPLDTWLQLCKAALDADVKQIFAQVTKFHASLFRFSEMKPMRNEVRLGQLILCGWFLITHDTKAPPISIGIDELLDAPYGGSIWHALTLSAQREDSSRWGWWEFGEAQPMGAKILGLPAAIDKAALILMARHGITELIQANSESQGIAFRLIQQVAPLRVNWKSSYGDVGKLDAIEEMLKRVVETWNKEQAEILWKAELSSEKISRFRTEFDQCLAKRDSIVSIFEAGQDEEFSHGDTFILGGLYYINKEFFVDSHAGYGVKMLAEDFARSLARGTDTMTIVHMAELGSVEVIEFDALKSRVAAFVSSAADPVVLILGSHMVATELGYFMGADLAPPVKSNAVMKLVYVPAQEFNVVLLDRPSTPKIKRWPEKKEGLRPVGSHNISMSVTAVQKDDKHKDPVSLLEIGSSYYWEAKDDVSVVLLQVNGAEY